MPVPAEGQIQYQQGGSFDPKLPVRFTARVQFDGDVNILDTVTINSTVANDNSTHFFMVEGTLPTSPSAAFTEGVVFNITSAGASNSGPFAVSAYLNAGYTGTFENAAFAAVNEVSGIATGMGSGNQGINAIALAVTSGLNVGIDASALNGDRNVGSYGEAIDLKNGATNIGGMFVGRNTGTSPTQIGAYVGLNGNTPTFESAGLIADNSDQTSPIFLARDNGTKVWTIQDGGSVQGKMGTKALTEGVPTAFVRISVPQGTAVAGFVKYAVEANDGVDFQMRTGLLPFAMVNKSGAETGAAATVSTATETVAVSAGTLTMGVWTFVSNAADTLDILADATSSLAQTTLRINYSVELYGNAIVTVTPL